MTANNAIIPVPKLEPDFYEWWDRHEQKLAEVASRPDAQLVFIGDSITHLWECDDLNGRRGKPVWEACFGKYRPLNLGFGWDRTQNVLWRLDHGEFTGLQPRVVVLLIGTNNLTGTANARGNTPAEIVEGISAVIARIHGLSPQTRILSLGVLPRGASPTDPFRQSVAEINAGLVTVMANDPLVEVLDIGTRFLAADGTIPAALMNDGVHLTMPAYQIWADAILPVLEPWLD